MRKLNAMFHIEGEQLIKTSNGQPVPEEEPLFILRGRDRNAIRGIVSYIDACFADGCEEQRMRDLHAVLDDFRNFSSQHPARMKQPGVTRGR